MVQVTRGLPDPRFEVLGNLGNSLSDVLTNFAVDRTVNKLKNNPEFANAPASERLEKLVGALGRHGPTGQKRLQDYLLLEQQREKEKEQAKAERERLKQEGLISKQQGVLAKALRGEPLSSEEESSLPANAQLAIAKLKQPKAAPGGISGQPVPREVSQAILPILNQFKDANADELAAAFDEAGVPRAYSNSYIENRRRQDETNAKVKSKQGIENQKDVRDFVSKTLDENTHLQSEQETLDDIKSSLKDVSGIVSPGFLAQRLNLPFLESPGSKLFKTGQKRLFEDFRKVFPKGTNADLMVYEKLLPEVGASAQANNLVIQQRQAKLNINKARNQIALQLSEEHPEWSVNKIRQETERQLDPLREKELEKWRSIAEQTITGKAKPGSRGPLSLDKARQYLNKYGNRAEAEAAARKDGYEF